MPMVSDPLAIHFIIRQRPREAEAAYESGKVWTSLDHAPTSRFSDHAAASRLVGNESALLRSPPRQRIHRMADFPAEFAAAHSYSAFLEKFGTDEHRRRWAGVHAAISLSPDQRTLLGGFKRKLDVLCMAGAWCGDCVNQCPIFEHFERASSVIAVRFADRDDRPQLAGALRICGGARVPAVVFLSEDGHEVGRYGDRTLSKYRQLAGQLAGASCSTGLAPPPADLLAATVKDWLNEFERVQLMLRLSPRLRERHGD